MKIGLGLGITRQSKGGGAAIPPAPPPSAPALTTQDNSINAPSFSFTSATGYPPELNFILDETVTVDDWLRVVASPNRDLSSPLFIFDHQLTAANIAGTSPIAVAPGLASITSPAQTYFGPYIIQPDGNYSATTLKKHGDTVAPVLTIASSGNTNDGSPFSHAWSSSEYVAIAFSGADGALMESSPAAGTSGVIRLVSNANTNRAAKQIYSFNVVATDDAGLSDTEAVTLTVNSLASAALVTGPGTGSGANANCNQYIICDGYRAQGTLDVGAPVQVKSIDAPPTPTATFQVTVNAIGTSRQMMGWTDGASSVGLTVNIPGSNGGPGCTLQYTGGATAHVIHRNGATQAASTNSAVAVGDIFITTRNATTNVVTFQRKRISDGTTETIATVTLTSAIPTNWQAVVGMDNNIDDLTASFGW